MVAYNKYSREGRIVLTSILRNMSKKNTFTFRSFAETHAVPKSTAHGWLKRSCDLGYHRCTAVQKVGLIMDEITDKNVCYTLKDVISHLHRKTGVTVSESTVSRAMKQSCISKQKVYPYKPVNESVDTLRNTFSSHFGGQTGQTKFHDMISIDECCVYLNCNRKAVWQKRGKKLRMADANHGSRKKLSIIMAIQPTYGVVHWDCVQGNYNKKLFGNFITQLAMKLPKNNAQRDLLMDNVAFHKSAETRVLYKAHGFVPHFTPPYTSEWNPIERAFHILKSSFRKTPPDEITDVARATCCLQVVCTKAITASKISNIYDHVQRQVSANLPLGMNVSIL
jgi:transposase